MCHTLHRPKEFNNLFPLGPPSFTHPSQPRWAFNPRWKPAVTSREQRASCTNSCVCGRGTKPVGRPDRCWFSPLDSRKNQTWPTWPQENGGVWWKNMTNFSREGRKNNRMILNFWIFWDFQVWEMFWYNQTNWRSPKIATQLVVFRGWFSGP